MRLPLRGVTNEGVGLFLAGNVLVGSGLFFHGFLYNFYLGALGLDESVMGLAAAALTAGGLVALLPAGRMVDRLGVRFTLIAATACAAAGLAAGAIAETPPGIYASALLAGLGTVSWRVSMAPFIMARTAPDRRARIFSWNVALLVGSGAVWMMAGGGIADWLQRAGSVGPVAAQRITLLVGAAATLLAAPLFSVACRRRDVSATPTPERSGPVRPPVRLGPLSVSVAVIAFWMTGPALVLPFFNIFFSGVHRLEVAQVGTVFGIAHLGTAGLLFLNGVVAGRVGPRPVLAVWTMVFPPVLCLLAVTSGIEVAIGLYFLQGIVSPASNPLIDQILLSDAPPAKHGTVSSWRNAATEVAGILGAAFGGLILRDLGFQTLFVLAGTFGAIAAVVLWIVLQRLNTARSVA